MIVSGVDLGTGKSLTGEVNPLKKEVKVLEGKKPSKVIYGFPVNRSIFRKYLFPFKNKDKIEKAVRGNLQIDLPVPFDEVEYSYVYRERPEDGKVEVFCVIVKKEDLKDFDEKSSVDSEIFALMRLTKFHYIHNGVIVHFSKDYIYLISFRNNFPETVRVIREEEIHKKNLIEKKTVMFSGIVPDYIQEKIEKNRILNNPTENPEYNVAFGLVLKGIDEFGIDFIHKDEEEVLSKFIKGAGYLALSIILINVGLFVGNTIKSEELKKVKSKEKEIFIKYFNASGTVYDPLMQAEGLVASVQKSGETYKDAADVLKQIGKAKDVANITEIYRINIDGSMFTVQGKATSISDVEKFKNVLSMEFKAQINETVSTPEGNVRFSVKGEI